MQSSGNFRSSRLGDYGYRLGHSRDGHEVKYRELEFEHTLVMLSAPQEMFCKAIALQRSEKTKRNGQIHLGVD